MDLRKLLKYVPLVHHGFFLNLPYNHGNNHEQLGSDDSDFLSD